jgi:hypothetical protein
VSQPPEIRYEVFEPVRAESRLAQLIDAEDSGCRFPSTSLASIRRLHADRRGAISVLFILLSFVFFTGLAATWNTGKATSARLHTQIVADTAAYGAATWMSRGMNQITATNILIQRNATAFGIAFDCMPMGIVWAILVIKNWIEAVEEACAACLLACAACGAAMAAYIAAVEVPIMVAFFAGTLPEAIPGLMEFPQRITALKDYQDAWVEAIPKAIEDQREKFEEYYGTKIRYTQPGNGEGEVKLPVEEGNLLTCMFPYMYRFYQKDHNIPDDYNFNIIAVGKGEDEWEKLYHVGMVLGWLLNGMSHYVLTTQTAMFEQPPNTLEEWQDFSVIATAMSENVSEDYRVAPGLFDWAYSPDDVMIAYAQAETYNAPSEVMSKVPVLGVLADIFPFRVWTFLGWEWQPRLALGDQLRTALENDNEMRDMWERIDINSSLYGKLPDATHH